MSILRTFGLAVELSCCYHHPRENAARIYGRALDIIGAIVYGGHMRFVHDRHVSLYILYYVSICIYEKIIPKLIELKCLGSGVQRSKS